MNCYECRREIEEASLHRLLSHEARAHVEACGTCRVLRDERSALSGLLGELEVVAAPSNFEAQLRARIVAKQSARRRFSFQPSFAPSTLSIALAACFALTVSAVLLFQPTQPPQRNIISTTESPTDISAVHPATASNTADAYPPAWGEAAKTTLDARAPFRNTTESISLTQPRRLLHTAARFVRPAAVFVATKARVDSESFSAGAAQVVTPRASASLDSPSSSDAQSSVPPTEAVSVRVSSHPLEVTLLDERGITRLISVEPVSFGATQLAGSSDKAKLTSPSSGQGIW